MAPKKFPAKLGACIDLAYELRTKRLEYQREVDERLEAMKTAERDLNDHIINTFTKSELDGAKGQLCSASILHKVKYRAKDFLEVWKWAKKFDRPDIFEKRLAQSTVKELMEDGKEVPGVDAYEYKELSLTKLG